jgi:hypothetical protein
VIEMRKLLFTLSFTLSLLLAGCGQKTAPQAVVKPSQQTVQFPKATDIQHVYVVAGLAARSFSPKNQSETLSQIETWLKTAQPVSVQLPPKPNPPITTSANVAPAALLLQLSSKQDITISPVFYMSGNSQKLDDLFHYVDGVIAYQVGNKTVYFKDPELYNWLKTNQWQKQFNIK